MTEIKGDGEKRAVRSKLYRTGTLFLIGLIGFVLTIFSLWCFGVVYFLFPFKPGFSATFFALLILACGVGWFVRKLRLAAVITGSVLYVMTLCLWFSVNPDNDKAWQKPWGRMPTATFQGNNVTVNNVRDFNYRSENDYDPEYITETYDLDKLNELCLVTSFWDGNKLICHTMLDFGFSDGKHVVVSVETRLPEGKEQSSLGGLFKQYEVLAIFGTRRDLLMLRTNYRREDVYMYPTTSSQTEVRKLFVLLLNGINRLKAKPAFYNTLTTNCTTSLVPAIRQIRPPRGWSIQLILNGLSPEMAFKNGWFIRLPEESFAGCEARAYITNFMQQCPDRNRYSATLDQKLKPIFAGNK